MPKRKRKKTKSKWSHDAEVMTPETYLAGVPLCSACQVQAPTTRRNLCGDCHENSVSADPAYDEERNLEWDSK